MIKEIVNFTEHILPSANSMNLNLSEGLYIAIDENSEGELYQAEEQVFSKKSEMNDYFDYCLELQTRVQPVSNAKIFNPNKKIFGNSCSGFALYFNKKNLKKNLEKDGKALIQKEVEQYFKGASSFVIEEKHKDWVSKFQNFCIQNLVELLKSNSFYIEAKDDFDVHLFLKMPNLSDYQTIYDAYVAKNVFNKDDYNTKVDDVIYGVADTMSSFSDKKMYWRHKTAPFEFNYRMTGESAKVLWQFFELRKRVLPNPLPIFIDKAELNEKVIGLLKDNDEEKKITYSQIIKKVFENEKDKSNYYLLFFQKGVIADIDIIPAFDYQLNIKIYEVFKLGGKQEGMINDVFEFEREVANKIFNNQLVVTTKKGELWMKYFDNDIDATYMSENTYNQLLKYRKSIYDFVYKAKRESIQNFMFRDMMQQGILDDIKRDETDKNGHSQREYNIKEKLNIWFSLYNFFDNQNSINMVNKTQDLWSKLKELGEKSDLHIQNDDEFAFATGQVIRYLLNQSMVAERNHSLLEPFLQKTEAGLLKLAIANTFNTYKHEIAFYKGEIRYTFDRLMSQVMGFEPETKNMKELLPLILAGYFSESLFKRENSNVNSN